MHAGRKYTSSRMNVGGGRMPDVPRKGHPVRRFTRTGYYVVRIPSSDAPRRRDSRRTRRRSALAPRRRGRGAVRRLPADTVLVVNGDDPQLGVLADAHERSVVFGLDDRRLARPSLQHAADSKYCVRCGTPYDYAAAYVGHLGEYRCPNCGHARPALDVAGRAVELHGLDRAEFDLVTPEGTR